MCAALLQLFAFSACKCQREGGREERRKGGREGERESVCERERERVKKSLSAFTACISARGREGGRREERASESERERERGRSRERGGKEGRPLRSLRDL